MRSSLTLVLLLFACCATCLKAAPAPQTRPWRVAVIGGYPTGYLGLLALHGLPRARLDDSEIANPERLRQFDIVITCQRGPWATEEVARLLEQYAADGGIVVVEHVPPPGTDVLPGRRIGAAASTNLRFVASDSPISKGLPELGLLKIAGNGAAAVVPDASSKAIVLARFTDEEAPEKVRNHFIVDGQGAPAILQIPHGQGQIIYCGPVVSQHLALRGREFEPFVCNLLDAVSGGQLRDRMFSGNLDPAQLLSTPPPAGQPRAYPQPKTAARDAPEGMDTLEDAANLQDFRLTGTLPAEGEAKVLVGYWSPGDVDELTFASGKLILKRWQNGKVLGQKSMDLASLSGEVAIMRRQGLLTVTQGRQTVCSRMLAPLTQGGLAAQGLADPAYQPLTAVSFSDDFMRENGVTGEWEAQSGNWSVVASEGRPEMGANPFNYQVNAGGGDAISLAGNEFWTDYACEVSIQAAAPAAGVIANYVDANHYDLLKLVFADDPRASRLQILAHRDGSDKVLVEGVVTAARADWHDLEFRTSRGRLQGRLNGDLVVEAAAERGAVGRIGLFCRQGTASFDDVEVSSWLASPPDPAPRLEEMVPAGGVWAAKDDGEWLAGSGTGGGRLVLPWPAVTDCQASIKVVLNQAEAGGLVFRSTGQTHLVAALTRDGDKLRLNLFREGAGRATLASQPVAGRPTEGHIVGVTCYGPHVAASVDGKVVADVLDDGPQAGTAGLYVRGASPAQFRLLRAWQEPSPQRLVDEPTPNFAGIIDRHTWAGRSGAWTPDPAQLNCFWHLGFFPGEVTADVGIHPAEVGETVTQLHLGRRQGPDSGYTLRARRQWSSDAVELQLSLAGKPVAKASARVAAGEAYALSFQRSGRDILASVNHRPALLHHDTQYRPWLDTLGLDNGGQLIYPEDVAVSSPWVHDYTFETAPSDWAVESGTWRVSSRWSCNPGWSWFAGVNQSGPALVSTRQSYVGDIDVVTYVAAKMLPSGGGYSEVLTDVHFGCCASSFGSDSGYRFVVGGKGNTWTGLLRNGQEVATCDYKIPQTGIHNDWTRLTIRKRGAKVALWVWDTPLLEWEDPEPLTGGLVSVGTLNNGILVPRVSIYGKQAPRETPPTALAVGGREGGGLALTPRQLFTFAADQAKPEFGGDFGLWPQQTDCQGTATFVAGEDAEGGPGGAMKVEYTIKANPKSFSLWLTSGSNNADLSAYDRFVLYARGDVPSVTLVVKDTSATDPTAPNGIADYVVKGLSDKWKRFEIPFRDFVPRQAGAKINWGAINHIGIAMIAPANAEAGTFWVDNLRAEQGAAKPAKGR
mgnify:CR=1 FL=1